MPPNDSPGKPINLLKFHKPKLRINESSTLPPLSDESKQCLRALAAYRTPKRRFTFPRKRCAAVLVALFVGRQGDLYVLLSRRSATLRTYAGDTSLPGGKVDAQDKYLEDTARREAFEEIGLPLDRRRVPLLCILEPWLAGNQLIVTPVVVLITDNSLRPILNAAEVASLFSHPLASFLSSTPPFPAETELVEVEYHTYMDIDWHNMGKVRMHRFLTGREAGGIKPVFGLTASILIRVATIGYGRVPEFDEDAPDSPSMDLRIAYALLTMDKFREALKEQGIPNPDAAVDPALAKEVRARLEDRRRRREATEGVPPERAEVEVYQKGENRRRKGRERKIRSRL
ncbi:hypothetical protein PLICRDRAFT_33350 [Plicaturopsis crispa FD-325 SS-3]|nr:hypothetical protein PLICRDRAFT_33350 [Plicaturopsis crispa FD-325 SS-3]